MDGRTQFWRERAAAVRTIANILNNLPARDAMLKLADDYLQLANHDDDVERVANG
jgi:hypothetical protein